MSDWEIDPPAKDALLSRQPRAPQVISGGAPPPSRTGDDPLSSPSSPEAVASTPSDPSTSPASGLRRLSVLWLAVAGVMLLVGLLGGYLIARSETSHDAAALVEANARLAQMQAALAQSEERNWSYFRATEALKAELERGSAGQPTTTASGSVARDGVYSEGVYVVGEDISAGTYDGVVEGDFGYWARLKGTDGAIASIIENGLVKGPFVLTVESTDKALELRGVTLTSR